MWVAITVNMFHLGESVTGLPPVKAGKVTWKVTRQDIIIIIIIIITTTTTTSSLMHRSSV
jgi:hypothetical protein